MMSFTDAVKTCFRKYFQFSGRARRSEYWWFALFCLILLILAEAIDAAVFSASYMNEYWTPFASIVFIATIIPSLSVGWRRMHDVGRSGLWNFLYVAPAIWMGAAAVTLFGSESDLTAVGVIAMILGVIAFLACIVYVIVLLATDSDPGPNRFGPSPKYGSDDIF